MTVLTVRDSERIVYDIPDIKGEICRAQADNCSNWRISSLEIRYTVLGSERKEELRWPSES